MSRPCAARCSADSVRRAVLVFLDGVGVGESDPDINPIARAELPTLDTLLGGVRPFRDTVPIVTTRASALGLDATLGIDGVPQSGTGHAALFTGHNAAAEFGRHFGPWVPTQLRLALGANSVLARVWGRGLPVAFANAYPEELVESAGTGVDAMLRLPGFLRAGPPIVALAIGALNRHTAELERGDAVASEITNEGWREHLGRTTLPVISARTAGHNLARIAETNALTLFAHYSTDAAGHTHRMDDCVAAIERIDEFLGGLLEGVRAEDLVLVVSDHGNLEDVRVGHTRNPALALVIGPGHAEIARRLGSIVDVAPVLEAWVTTFDR
jgi:2,3-bisphosphoglycerate-independent phosphoglycerate mutase